ncbi:MAG: biopolymer transporter ExbD [Acidobacteriota bacterium]|nr:biopolymer transporter ExbD [Acidobacteriota bacterium]MDH3784889.1 biopolymer transporter ExbD [Acidobacteriota bacterium]
MQFGRNTHRRTAAAINIAPLVDVIFLLVIFFAVSTTFLESSGLKLELPQTRSTAKQELKDLTVALDADGRLSFEGKIVEPAELKERLKALLVESDDKLVVLRADRSTAHGDVVKVMDLIRDAGASGLTVAARTAAGE